MMTYWTLKGDERLATAPRDTLKKIHDVVQEGTDFVLCAVKEQEEQQVDNNSSSSSGRVSLQDSWSKTIELPSSATVEEAGDNSDITGDSKRLRTNSYRPYYKVRRIFHPQRKTPPSLLSAIRRKGARLFAPNGTSVNSIYLVLDFDEAFTMTIYLSPLTVTLRAKVPGDTGSSTSGDRISNRSNAATVAC